MNSTGFKNVTFDRQRASSKPYKAQLSKPRAHLGYFMTPEEAALTVARFRNTEGKAAALAAAAPEPASMTAAQAHAAAPADGLAPPPSDRPRKKARGSSSTNPVWLPPHLVLVALP